MYVVKSESLIRISVFLKGEEFKRLIAEGVKLVVFNRLTDYFPEEEINSFISLVFLLKRIHIQYKVKFLLVTDCISKKRSFFQEEKILPIITSYRWLSCIPSRILVTSQPSRLFVPNTQTNTQPNTQTNTQPNAQLNTQSVTQPSTQPSCSTSGLTAFFRFIKPNDPTVRSITLYPSNYPQKNQEKL
ncbi:hypothetical protein NEFER03_0406 [Nematocida sp. LUAm3]|nr:hypothetical protein NEFER03_0406 [Nematocida sp. LUAm3]KAI5175978.1 hypothetical protein NEFER02_1824 [Nematocida sp. LUAm2]KAI5179074.1 hypothetical protein NEFER01_1941 [Nematocida sp. LUAm1]